MTKAGCLLVMVIDVHPQLVECEGAAEHYFNSCIAFANFHLASDIKNRFALIASNHTETKFLYPNVNEEPIKRQEDGCLEQLCHMDRLIVSELKKMLTGHKDVVQTESLISGAIGRALLYIKRKDVEDALAEKIHARILVIKSSSDTGGQYLNYINTYLTAQKMGTTIDVCAVGNDCGLLQQGSDITGGYYHRVDELENLLQVLICLYHPDVCMRKKLNNPAQESVDYRAACFCHRALIDMGNICSNCLSVYCKAVPLCTTCNVFFQTEMPMRKVLKRKR